MSESEQAQWMGKVLDVLKDIDGRLASLEQCVMPSMDRQGHSHLRVEEQGNV